MRKMIERAAVGGSSDQESGRARYRDWKGREETERRLSGTK